MKRGSDVEFITRETLLSLHSAVLKWKEICDRNLVLAVKDTIFFSQFRVLTFAYFDLKFETVRFRGDETDATRDSAKIMVAALPVKRHLMLRS